MHKLYVNSQNEFIMACPACERSRTIDASPYTTLARVVRIRITCPCGHQFAAELERRRNFRKPVNLKGTYSKSASGRPQSAGLMAVLDLSRTGLRLRLNQNREIRIGDRIIVQFQLDDARRSAIRKESVVRRIDGEDLGAEFIPLDPADPSVKAIGFYLFAA